MVSTLEVPLDGKACLRLGCCLQSESVKRSGGYTKKERKNKKSWRSEHSDGFSGILCFQPMAGCVVTTSYRRRLAGVGCEKGTTQRAVPWNSTRHRSACRWDDTSARDPGEVRPQPTLH